MFAVFLQLLCAAFLPFLRNYSGQEGVNFSGLLHREEFLLWRRLLREEEEATLFILSAQHLLLVPDVWLPPRCRFQTPEEREAASAGFDR